MSRRSPALLVAVLVYVQSGAVQAQKKSPELEARVQYERGIMAYNLERFDDAIAAFTRAYELDPAPTLLFNIAQSRWKKGENDRAIFYYRRYLEADPTAENRPVVESRIRELESARRTPAAPAAPAPIQLTVPTPLTAAMTPPPHVQAAPEPPARPPLHHRPWFWAVVGATAAATVVTVLLLSSKKAAAGCAPSDCNLDPLAGKGP